MRTTPLLAAFAALLMLGVPASAQYGPYSPAPQPFASGVGAQQYDSNYGPSLPSAINPADLPPVYPARTYTRGPGGILLPTDNIPPPSASYLPPASLGVAPAFPTTAYTGGQITNLADQLVAQSNAFLQAFLPKVRVVPQGRLFMNDATALRNAAAQFRQAAATGAPPARLRADFAQVATLWQRLENRMARVSRGYIGPNIATALQMGGTVQQIQQLLP